jgi:hypothetical protein
MLPALNPETERAGTDKNRKTAAVFVLCATLSVLPKSAGQNSKATRHFVSGDLSKLRSGPKRESHRETELTNRG